MNGRLTLFLYRHELDSIDEYSSTLPSATTIGKMWKRRDLTAICSGYVVGLYAFHIEPETDRDRRLHPDGFTRILWFDVRLREGPKPPGWHAPDWTNYAAWLKERNG